MQILSFSIKGKPKAAGITLKWIILANPQVNVNCDGKRPTDSIVVQNHATELKSQHNRLIEANKLQLSLTLKTTKSHQQHIK
jgi:hypothetical protein